MPVVLRLKGYKIWFYSADLEEPPHVHVAKESREAKFWLNPLKVARAGALKTEELREVERILREHQQFLLQTWTRELNRRGYS